MGESGEPPGRVLRGRDALQEGQAGRPGLEAGIGGWAPGFRGPPLTLALAAQNAPASERGAAGARRNGI